MTGLVYAAGYAGQLHCLDAETGQCHWVREAGLHLWTRVTSDAEGILVRAAQQALHQLEGVPEPA